MDRQEVFNKVVTFLVKQGVGSFRSAAGRKVCLYRSADGRKCAIGCLIPDDLYTEDMDALGDGILINAPVRKALEKAGYEMDRGDLLFLSRLQIVHDNRTFSGLPFAMDSFRRFAKQEGLTLPEVAP